MLVLRRGTVVEAGPEEGPEQRLVVEIAGERRAAVADVAMVGRAEPGDDVVVNAQAVDLRLGSGGFDIVHVNLTRGLDGSGVPGAHVMKLNYSSLQHAVLPVEGEDLAVPLDRPVAVFSLHGQLAPLAWAFGQAAPGAKLGFVQTGGGALPGGHSRVVRDLRDRGLLVGHLTAAPTYGGEAEAITSAGAIHHGLHDLGWDAAVSGPGPGILGSVFRMLDTGDMKRKSKQFIDELGIRTLQNIDQSVETLSGGQRQVVAVARTAAFGSKVVILDEPTAALGVRETGQVLRLVKDLRDRGLGIILISHNMPNVFEVADRIHIQRLGRGIGVITPKSHTPAEAVAIMTGAVTLDGDGSGPARGTKGASTGATPTPPAQR